MANTKEDQTVTISLCRYTQLVIADQFTKISIAANVEDDASERETLVDRGNALAKTFIDLCRHNVEHHEEEEKTEIAGILKIGKHVCTTPEVVC